MMRKTSYGLWFAAAASVAMIVAYAECNRITAPNTNVNDSGPPNCVKVVTYNQQCVKPTPDDWTKGCTEAPGQVRQETYNGTLIGFKFSINVCTIEVGIDCQHCSYSSNPNSTTQVSGTITTTYTCT
jgi:hypothetical protein